MKGFFVGPTYQASSRAIACERAINLFPEAIESPNAKAKYVYRNTPGLRNFGTLTDRPGRSIFEINGRCFAVAGTTLFEIKANGTVVALGAVGASGDPAGMASNGDRGHQVMVVSGGLGYIYNTATSVFSPIVDPQFPVGVVNCAYIDDYLIAITRDRFGISALGDGLTWGGDEGQRAGAPENLVNAISDHELLWLMGSLRTELWQDTGAASFPFAPISGAFIEQGLAAPWALTQFADVVAWLGQDVHGSRVLNIVQGYAPQRISNHAIEGFLARYDSIADARLFTYQIEGHAMLVLTIPSQKATWVYDAATQLFHEWLYWNTYTGQYEAARVCCHAYAFGKHLGLDRETGAIHEITPDVYDNAGEAIRWLRRAPRPSEENKMIFDHRFELALEMGVGLAVGQGSDPQIGLRTSDDGGFTWGNDRYVSMGAKGKYADRAAWDALGGARNRVYEVFGSEPVKTVITDAYLTATVGIH